jgi:hypothetical protein
MICVLKNRKTWLPEMPQLIEIEVIQRQPSPARGIRKCASEMLTAMRRFSIHTMERGQAQR